MSRRLDEIEQRKQLLVARANIQRSELNYLAQIVDRPFRIVDAMLGVGRAFSMQPVFRASSRLLTPRHRLLFWAGRIFVGWEIYRVIREQWPRRRP
jgi:hypothetical protein